MDADELAAEFEDKASVRAAGGTTGGRKAAGGGGGGGGKGKPGDGGKQREKQISMALSRLLRHQALNAGIKLDKEGYAPLDRVVSGCLLSAFSISLLFGHLKDGVLVSVSYQQAHAVLWRRVLSTLISVYLSALLRFLP